MRYHRKRSAYTKVSSSNIFLEKKVSIFLKIFFLFLIIDLHAQGKGVKIVSEEWTLEFLPGSKRASDPTLYKIVSSIGSLDEDVPIKDEVIEILEEMEQHSYDSNNGKISDAKIFVTNNNKRCEYNYLRAIRENVPLIIWCNDLVQPSNVEVLGKLNHNFNRSLNFFLLI